MAGRDLAERQQAARERIPYFLELLDAAGHPLRPGATVLDFGCGLGTYARELQAHGFDAYGCDFAEEMGDVDDRLRVIERPYRLPFADGSFDCVISDQVFEHVQDYGRALREIRRVLRDGGVSLHLFPGRYSLREGHSLVPLATVLRSRWWLRLWASLGLRNEFQRGRDARAVADHNHAFLHEQTTYHSRSRLLREARAVFPRARLIEREVLTARPRAQHLRHVPGAAMIFCEMRGRALLLS